MKRLLPFLLVLCLLSGCVLTQGPGETSCPTAETESIPPTETTPPLPDFLDCLAYANVLSETFGISIVIGDAALAVPPWDYDLEPETDPAVLYPELQRLERCLKNFPEGMLAALSDASGRLQISLVKTIRGKAALGGLNTAAGLQYEEDGTFYVALVCGLPTSHTLYHELFHIMDSFILRTTSVYEDWSSLNPREFQYRYDFRETELGPDRAYLQGDTRAFIDTYSMTFPEEDRARIMEYAMTPGNRWLFDSPSMQAKLSLLSLGIREAFGLTEEPRQFHWEQYLNIS